MADAIKSDDWHTAADLAEGLIEWLAKDGFPPIITGTRAFDMIAARAACEAISAWSFA
jgi:hypothetical protein